MIVQWTCKASPSSTFWLIHCMDTPTLTIDIQGAHVYNAGNADPPLASLNNLAGNIWEMLIRSSDVPTSVKGACKTAETCHSTP